MLSLLKKEFARTRSYARTPLSSSPACPRREPAERGSPASGLDRGQVDDVLDHEIAEGEELLIRGRGAPRLDVVAPSEQAPHLVVQGPLAPAAGEVVPYRNPHTSNHT